MSDYPFNTIWLNGRRVSVDRILTDNEEAITPFETSTLQLIKDWLQGREQFVVSTSGSTGTPREITFSREQMIASANGTVKALGLKEGDTALVCIDTRYIGGIMMVVRALVHRLNIRAVDPVILPLQKLPIDQCVDFAAFVPLQVHSMLGSKHPHLINNVKSAIIGGAALHDQDVNALQNFQCRCYATYGMTETISHIALQRLNGESANDFFETLPGIKVTVDERDCLIIKTPYLEEAIVTNDLVKLLSPTRFQWVGRWDHIINTGGVKVSPEKIEAAIRRALAGVPDAFRFFVHGVPDRKLGSRVVLVAEVPQDEEEEQRLVDKLSEAILSAADLQKYEAPKEIHFTSSFALTGNGKINRQRSLEKVTRTLPVRK